MTRHTCQGCPTVTGDGLGVYLNGQGGRAEGCYCPSCAEVAAFWESVEPGTLSFCEGCGVAVMESDTCYLMAATFCPPCFLGTFASEKITQ